MNVKIVKEKTKIKKTNKKQNKTALAYCMQMSYVNPKQNTTFGTRKTNRIINMTQSCSFPFGTFLSSNVSEIKKKNMPFIRQRQKYAYEVIKK
ncbi:hypothetical protein GDO86_012727 [Hymenochirus boettgeri]|uniref:Uncharacterized protein n=1 Tax=Hymenochirus boettgeri TaxID=247094 RepID=A0A8T2ITR9_9PIPI|nr:hypothetical protein GDO86_012727 [Hymenochirus boettgeri]